jgi:sugar phosphate isomerase/epimerase
MSDPKLSISACTTYTASLEEDLEAYRQAGAQGIGLWEFKLPRGQDEATLDKLRASGLETTICVPEVPSIVPDPFFTDPKDPAERRDALIAAIRRLARFEPVACLCLTGDPANYEPSTMRRLVVEGLRAAAEVAGELGLTLGLEPLRRTSGSLVTTLPDTLELVDEIGAGNLRVVVDTWHCWDLPGILDDLGRYADRIVGLQVNDWREPTRSWCDRVLPGDGVIDLPAIFGALDAAGFDGWYDIEIFSDNGLFGNDYPDSLWKQDPREVARRGVAQLQRLWSARHKEDQVP